MFNLTQDELSSIIQLAEQPVRSISVDLTIAKERLETSFHKLIKNDSPNIRLGYLVYDQSCCTDYWEYYGSGDQFFSFKNQFDLDEKVHELCRDEQLFLRVEKYQHSQVHYSVLQTTAYPHRSWDVSACALLVPSKDIQDYCKKHVWDDQRLVEYANSVLAEYSQWCNGDVYGVVTHDLVVNQKVLEEVSTDSCYGLIGYTQAKTALAEAIHH